MTLTAGTPQYFDRRVADLERRLQESEERFRLLVAGIQDHAIFMLDPRGHVIDWNSAAEHVTGWPEEEILNRRFTVFFPDEALARGDPDSHLRIAASEGKFVERAQRQRKDGSRFWAAVEMTALYDAKGPDGKGALRGFANVLRDVSDTVRASRDVAESRARLAAIVESAMDAIITVDAEQTIVVFNNAAEKMFGYAQEDIVGRKLDVLIPERFRRDHAGQVRDFKAPGIVSRVMGRSGALSARRANGDEFPIDASISQASLDGERFFSIILRDITERARAEERQALLLRELGHRVKNTLTVVQAIAAQTRRHAKGEQFHEAFSGRLAALASAHNLLLQGEWKGASLNDVAAIAFAPYGDEPARRQWSLDGPKIWLEANEAVTLSLAFYEMATNAVKFGALSDANGRVDVRWLLDAANDRPILAIDWLERNGPMVVLPERSGFGSRLLLQAVANEFRGAAELSFPPSGARCRLRIPLSDRVKALS